MLARHHGKHSTDLIARKHDRQSTLFTWAADRRKPEQFDLKYMSVEEENRRQGLAMSRRRNPLVIGQSPEEHLDLYLPQTGWMTHLMEAKKFPDPEDISLLGPDAVVQIPNAFAAPTENSRGRELMVFCCRHNQVADTVPRNCTAAANGRRSAVQMRRKGVLCGHMIMLNGC